MAFPLPHNPRPKAGDSLGHSLMVSSTPLDTSHSDAIMWSKHAYLPDEGMISIGGFSGVCIKESLSGLGQRVAS